MSFYLLQRQNDVVSPGSLAQIEEPVLRSNLQWGGGEERGAGLTSGCSFGFQSHMMSELAGTAGDWGFGPTSEQWAGGRRKADGNGDSTKRPYGLPKP